MANIWFRNFGLDTQEQLLQVTLDRPTETASHIPRRNGCHRDTGITTELRKVLRNKVCLFCLCDRYVYQLGRWREVERGGERWREVTGDGKRMSSPILRSKMAKVRHS